MAAFRAGREDPPDRAARRDPEAPVGLAVQVVAALVAPVVRADLVARVVRRRRSRPPNVPRRSLPRLAAAS
ncbi:hypothetical protein [Amycolatopsis thermoflava]|uniref:Uncharacterized protein n=1 Tax=Amycolatopsis thermoflava TaxID=84480 RepID=A0A3N2GUT8_9PSEU|nr:hypothetical protein [Amycolatopsis thermoflava]ROS40377.1 hypothetical protein EDD35_2710 [Amycolatopsis thermoflava]